MHPTLHVLALFTVTVLLDDVSGHLFPPAISHMLTDELALPKDYRRQSDSSAQCISDKLDAAFAGDNAFASNCRFLEFELEGVIINDTSSLQSTINSYYSTFCIPECGNVIIDAYNDCGIGTGEFSLPVYVDFLIGLCGTNKNGEKCYQKYGDAIDLLINVTYCYFDYTANDVCNCRSELLEAVREQGCCHNVYHDFNHIWQAHIIADDLYDACNVDLPTGCNNSPITAGNSPTAADNRPTTTGNNRTTTEESGHGVMTRIALVPLISVLIFSVVFG